MKWLALYIGGQSWVVWLASPNSKHLCQDGKRLLGSCNYERCRIYINRELSPPLREDVLLHEIFHALLHVTGAEAAYDGDPQKDEDLVKAITPAWHRLLKDLGFQFPAGP